MKFLRKLLAVIVAAVSLSCLCLPLSACTNRNTGYKQIGTKDFLTAEGSLVKNKKGETVWLRGVNAGGLFVTEHWMTGFVYGSTPSNDFRSLTQTFISRFGEDYTQDIWAEYRSCWWTEEDFKTCADIGMTVIRLPFTYMNVDFDAVTDYAKAGKNYDFSALDEFVSGAAKYGMYTILDLHGAYGSQNGQDHSGQIIGSANDVDFYGNEQMMGLTAKLWGELAAHYKDNPAVAGYDILNEPGEKAGSTTERHWNFYDMAYKAIREKGDNHIVILESCWNGENLPRPEAYGWKNIMYSFHHYAGTQLSETDFNIDWNGKIANVTSQDFGVPLQMGEFTCYSNANNWEYCLELLNRSDWHWTSWTYKVWGSMPWGIVNIIAENKDKINASEDSYDNIIEKFQKLRSDGENANKYTFYAKDEENKKLEDVIGEGCKAPSYEQKLQAGEYSLQIGGQNLTLGKIVNGTQTLSIGDGDAVPLTVTYNPLKDGSAAITSGANNLAVYGLGGNDFAVLNGDISNAARFYPVVCGEGQVMLISYSTCRYLRVDDNGMLRVDALHPSEAAVFTVKSLND